MKRIRSHVACVFVAGIAFSAVAPACADNDQSLFIRGALAPSASRASGSCLYTDDPKQAFLFSATLDIALADTYQAVLLVGNQLVAHADSTGNRLESNRVHLNGAVVKVTDNGGDTFTFSRDFTSFGSSFVDPQTNNTPAFAPMAVTVFDAATKALLAPQLPLRSSRKSTIVTVKIFGTSLGGKEVETGEFQLPLEVCNGCLVSFADGDDLAKPGFDCDKPLAAAAGGSTGSVGPCLPGQDAPISCQTCVGTNPRCDPRQP